MSAVIQIKRPRSAEIRESVPAALEKDSARRDSVRDSGQLPDTDSVLRATVRERQDFAGDLQDFHFLFLRFQYYS